jgi:hypothetical protein
VENLAPGVAVFAVLFFLSGCSDWNDTTGSQSMECQETGEAFQPDSWSESLARIRSEIELERCI